MACEPAARYVTSHTAWPVEMLTLADRHPSIGKPPSLNMTVPPSGVGETAAVNVTCCPATDGLGEEFSSVLVTAGSTICVSVRDVDPAKSAAPE